MSRRKLNFSETNICTLIEEVKKRPCLWYLEHEYYNDRCSITSAWEEISEKMQMEQSSLRQKWKTTRDLFKREISRYSVRNIEDYLGKWQYFKLLWFLHRPEETDTDDCEIIDISPESRDIKFEPNDNSDFDENGDPDSDPLPDQQIKIDPDDDYDLMFLKSLTPYFRELEPMRRLVVRNKIQDMLLNEIAAQKVAKRKFK